ncbi:MAG: thioredoxin family protein [Clostridia bacterium]|nr:thioredoxin family protein [Clostridia bacterium]
MSIENLTEKTFNKALETEKPVIIDFYATWCGSCKSLEGNIQEFAQENPDVDVYKINVDENMDIADRYGIINVPTLLVFSGRKIKNKGVGYMSKREIGNLLN